jgi:hypothetical protein
MRYSSIVVGGALSMALTSMAVAEQPRQSHVASLQPSCADRLTGSVCPTSRPAAASEPEGVRVADECAEDCGIVFRHCIDVGNDRDYCADNYDVCLNDCDE